MAYRCKLWSLERKHSKNKVHFSTNTDIILYRWPFTQKYTVILINRYVLEIVKEYFAKRKFHGICGLFYWKPCPRLILHIVQWNCRSPIVQFSDHRNFDISRCIFGVKKGWCNDGLVRINRRWNGHLIWRTLWASYFWSVWLQLYFDWHG